MFRDIALWLGFFIGLCKKKNKDGYIVYSFDNIHVNTIIIWMKCPFEAWNFRKMFNWDVFTFSYGMTRFNWSVARLLKRSLREIERSFLICVSTYKWTLTSVVHSVPKLHAKRVRNPWVTGKRVTHRKIEPLIAGTLVYCLSRHTVSLSPHADIPRTIEDISVDSLTLLFYPLRQITKVYRSEFI